VEVNTLNKQGLLSFFEKRLVSVTQLSTWRCHGAMMISDGKAMVLNNYLIFHQGISKNTRVYAPKHCIIIVHF